MKKLMVAAAAALTATIGFSVESSNIVGYQNKGGIAADGWYMVGFQFETLGKTALLDLNKNLVVSGIQAVSTSDMESDACQLQIPKASGGYYKYFYVSDALDEDDEPVGYNCWCDNDGYALEYSDQPTDIAIGTCSWIKVPSAARTGAITVSFSGQVYDQSTFAVSVWGNLGWNMIANPFPIALDPTKINMSQRTAVSTAVMESQACQIQVPKASGGYAKYFYVSNALDEDDEEVDYDCWCDNDGYILEVESIETIADPGQGFWLKVNGSNGQIQFSL